MYCVWCGREVSTVGYWPNKEGPTCMKCDRVKVILESNRKLKWRDVDKREKRLERDPYFFERTRRY